MERAKKKAHTCKKATIRFLICFVMGFLIGFAPSPTQKKTISTAPTERHFQLAPTPKAPTPKAPTAEQRSQSTTPQATPRPYHQSEHNTDDGGSSNLNRSLGETTTTTTTTTSPLSRHSEEEKLSSRNQLIIITPTTTAAARDHHGGLIMKDNLLRRMANTLRLVKPPLVWIVVESQPESPDLSEILRKTGVMYRHLVAKENSTSNVKEEMDHLRDLALNHIELHRLGGIVHFADLYNTYDLAFFEEIRAIEVFGAWPLAKLRKGKKKVGIEGPVCRASKVVGWHLKLDPNQNQTADQLPIHISSFGFNSSILWDPERWGRVTPTQHDKQQSSLNFVKQALVDEESKVKGIPGEDCSRINLWSTRSL